VRNFPAFLVVSDATTFEDLDFSGPIDPEEEGQAILTITKDGRFDGFLLWTHVTTTEGVAIDYLQNQQAWLPVYFPLSDDGVKVQTGDTISVRWRRTLCENGLNPDYFVQATIMGSNGRRAELSYQTKHYETAYLQTAIHRRLFAHWEKPASDLSLDAHRAYLEKRLPDYMIPSAFVFLDQLPRNANGKLDRKRLPAPGTCRPNLATPFTEPETPFQAKLAAIWSEVLKLDSVGLDDSFLDLGGHSLTAAQIMARIAVATGVELPLSAIFDHPSIRKLSALIEPRQAGQEPSAPQQPQAAAAPQDEDFMRLAIAQAAHASQTGGVPFGACIVRDGEVLASVHNAVSRSCDPTAHAEVHAIREACTRLGTTDLSGCTVFSTCEPCPMCFAACHEARIARIVHGAWLSDAEAAGLGTLSIPAAQLRTLGRASLTLTPEVLRQEVLALLADWKQRRRNAPAEGLYQDDKGFEAYNLAVGCSNLLEQAMSVIEPLLEKYPAAVPFQLLDIGSGTGTLTLRVLQSLDRRGIAAHADCIEPSEPAMRRLEARLQEAGLGRCLGSRHVLTWEQSAGALARVAARYDLILAHHSLYYVALSDHIVRGLFDLLAPGGHATLFMDAEESPIALVREVAGRHLGRRKLQLSGSRDLQASLEAASLPFKRLDLDVTWNVSALLDPQPGPLKTALAAFLALVAPGELSEQIAQIVTAETRALVSLKADRSLLSQPSRVFILHQSVHPAGGRAATATRREEPGRPASADELEALLADLESLSEEGARALARDMEAPREKKD
jgi:tRNA(Arg) A34 adenosine deaminase TadA/SAM-dependent methyltransferase/acyl carrier protein